MLLSHRRRQRSYALAGTAAPGRLRKIITALVILFLVYWVGSTILRWFGVGNPRERSAVSIEVDSGTSAEVSLDGDDWQRAENGMKVYWDDAVRTGASTRVTLGFFEGTRVRMNESTELEIYDSAKGKRESALKLILKRGSLFVDVPQYASFSGSIVRSVETPTFTYTLVPGTQAFIGASSLLVFRAEGLGVSIDASRHDTVVIGEGQKWVATGTLVTDLYAYRSPLDAASARDSFITESQDLLTRVTASTSSASSLPEGEFLTLSEPAVGASMDGSSLTIRGKVTKDVARIEVNGRNVPINEDGVSFVQTMVPPEGTDDVVVEVQAFDAGATLLADIKRTVKRLPLVLNPPNIDAPAKTGETFRTQSVEFVLRGTAPHGATGIMVNDYLLQLFDPAKGTWSYLAALRLGNLKEGSNRFDVFALYPGPGGTQRKSEAATVTILIEEGPTGVVSTASSAGSAGSSAPSKPVLNNAPLKPGSITVIAPAAGNSASISGTGTLIEGTTLRETDTVWVNDYRLQLYVPGKTTWNYIASSDIKNLKPGKNSYVIITRNAKGEVLDKLEYVINYQP